MTTKISKDNIQGTTITSAEIANDTIETTKIKDGTIANADVSPSAAIDITKISGAASSSDLNTIKDNVGLLGFKMAVNEGLTVFNFVDGVVDEFNDESGTDEAEGSNDLYNPDSDYYINSNTPDGGPSFEPVTFSAGFTTTSTTEPDTSTAGTNPQPGTGTAGVFTVPQGTSSVTTYLWGAGSGGLLGWHGYGFGGGGGFTTGDLAVTAGQSLGIYVGEGSEGAGGGGTKPAPLDIHPDGAGGMWGNHPSGGPGGPEKGGGTQSGQGSSGAGGTFIFLETEGTMTAAEVPNMTFAAGGSGGSGQQQQNSSGFGGAGGGSTGGSAAPGGAGGTQTSGGSGGNGHKTGYSGGLFYGGQSIDMPYPEIGGGGGGGYYGGGSGGHDQNSNNTGGGGGSGYIGHPQVSSASTTNGQNGTPTGTGLGGEAAGTASPFYPGDVGEGGGLNSNQDGSSGNPGGWTGDGEDGYILVTASGLNPVPAVSTSATVVSDTFTATTAPTSARIVVFEEDLDTPTLNTDIIASVSRDGTNFTTATLTDSGYVTGTSGQRILTGTADVSGQPSGTSMRWKLQLANNIVKIHGVSLQWS